MGLVLTPGQFPHLPTAGLGAPVRAFARPTGCRRGCRGCGPTAGCGCGRGRRCQDNADAHSQLHYLFARGISRSGLMGSVYLLLALFFLLIIPHLAHLWAVKDIGWGSSGPKFSTDFFKGNVKANGLFYLKNVRFPDQCTRVRPHHPRRQRPRSQPPVLREHAGRP